MGQLRIIAGQWRSRRIPFPDLPGVRPTSDRMRETLFNWLQPVIAGAHCLDLYAGSGALGIEALSRGAASALFVDNSRQVATALEENLKKLKAEGARVESLTALALLNSTPYPYDIIFLDPPFRQQALPALFQALAQGWVAPSGYIYVESECESALPELPPGWGLYRNSRSGGACCYLLERDRSAIYP